MQKTIKSVKPNVRDWSSSYGPMKSIDGAFTDDEGWTINCKPGNEAKVKADLEALVGKPLEGFVVEPTIDKKTNQQREYNGKPQWTLKQPQQGPGGFKPGGGKPWAEAYSQSREAVEAAQRSIQRSVALTQAVAFHAVTKIATPAVVLDTAGKFLEFLVEPAKPENPMPGFLATLKAVNEHRKGAGLHLADKTVMAEALNLRKWRIDGFSSWADLLDALGPSRFKQLGKAMDANPTKFEKEVHVNEEQAS